VGIPVSVLEAEDEVVILTMISLLTSDSEED
jgi:hypothetical protein